MGWLSVKDAGGSFSQMVCKVYKNGRLRYREIGASVRMTVLRNRRRSEMADRWTSVGIWAIEVERLAKLGR